MMVALLPKKNIAEEIIMCAHDWIGTPYLHQASIKGVGCDCLGLIRGVWREVFYGEPEQTPAYTPDWAESGGREQLADVASRHMKLIETRQFLPADMLVFRWRKHLPAKHLAIVSSPTTMIHAQEGVDVCQVPISPWWQRHIAYVFRFPETRLDRQKTINQKGTSI